MAIQFGRFYLDHGVRTSSQLITLRKNPIEEFNIPSNSTLHFTPRDTGTLGITDEDVLIANAGNRILVDVVGFYSGKTIGKPIKLARLLPKESRAYVKDYKGFNYYPMAKNLLSLAMVPYVINYSSIDQSYRYQAGGGVFFQRRYNYFSTVAARVAQELKETKRNQIILMDIPSTLPPVSKLREVEQSWVTNADKPMPLELRLRNFIDTDARFSLFQVWLWVGENRELSTLAQIPEEDYDRVSFLYVVNNQFVLMNMGKLNSWIKRAGNLKGIFPPSKIQRIILRMYMSLQQVVTVQEDEEIVDLGVIEEYKDTKLEDITDEGIRAAVAKTRDKIEKNDTDPLLNVDMAVGGMTGDIDVKVNKNMEDKIGEYRGVETDDDFDGLLASEIDKDLAQLETIDAQNQVLDMNTQKTYVPYKPTEFTHTSVIDSLTDDLASQGLLSAAEVRRAKGLARRIETIESPFVESRTVLEDLEIPKSLLEMGETQLMDDVPKGMFDKSALQYSLKNFDDKYVKEVLHKDVLNAVTHIQKAGIAVTDMKAERVDEYLGSYINLSVQLTPVVGSPTTVKIKLPIINEDGTFKSNGVTYTQRKQLVDVPIRKVSFDTVSLTSYMSKMFVTRTERAAFNYESWLVRRINAESMGEGARFSEVILNDVFDPTIKLPRTYSAISRHLSSFTFGNGVFYFDFNHIDNNFPKTALSKIDRTKFIPIAYLEKEGADILLTMDYNDQIWAVYPSGAKKPEALGSLSKFLDLDVTKEPVTYANVAVLGKDIPVGVLLGYQIGLGNLLATMKTKYRKERRGSRFVVEDDEFAIRFEDEVLIFKRTDPEACMVFNGFNRVKSVINKLSLYQLDHKDGYVKILDALGIPPRHEKYYKLMFNTWVDHITHDLLVDMEEPTDLVLLFLSAIEKLKDDQFDDPNGVSGSIIRGYQRISGMVYSELFGAVRQYVNNPMSKTAKVELNPNAVWFKIIQDQTVSPIEESNPIHALKEKEIVVYRGAGGRSAVSMTAKHRQYYKDSIGIISEANVDNGNVGTVMYLTADPNITSLRGTVKPLENLEEASRTKLQSTAMMVSAGADGDDKSFISYE